MKPNNMSISKLIVVIFICSNAFQGCSSEVNPYLDKDINLCVTIADREVKIDSTELVEAINKTRNVLSDLSGLGVVVFDKSNILFEHYTGKTGLDSPRFVNSETAFYIASTTKSLMASCILTLVESGDLGLDVPIVNYLPKLHFNSWLLNENKISIRDLLTHNSGINSRALEIRTSITGQYSDKILLELYADASGSFFKPAYSNLNYILLGLIIQEVTGKSWRHNLQHRLFDPLKMTRTFTKWPKPGTNNVALPLTMDQNKNLIHLPDQNPLQTNTLFPSGGVIASARDLSNYIQLFLNCGSLFDQRILNEETITQAISIDAQKESGGLHDYQGFGLGWEIAFHDSLKLALHNGSNKVGSRSYMGFSPELELGIIILSNENIVSPYVHGAIARYVLDAARNQIIASKNLETNLTRWKTKAEKRYNNRMEGRQYPVFDLPEQHLPDKPLSNLIGTYKSEEYGTLKVSISEGMLKLIIGNMNSSRTHRITAESFLADFGIESEQVNFTIKNNVATEVEFQNMGMVFKKVSSTLN
ncbi:MAG: serine hydrolase domain-containing protein [Balneola sp.]